MKGIIRLQCILTKYEQVKETSKQFRLSFGKVKEHQTFVEIKVKYESTHKEKRKRQRTIREKLLEVGEIIIFRTLKNE